MLDIRFIRKNFDLVVQSLKKRNSDLDLTDYQNLDNKRRALLQKVEALKMERNKASEQVARMKQQGEDPGNLFVIANLEETKVDGVKLNCPVEIQVDAFPRKMIKGKVVRITPAAAAKFALIPRDVTAGEFTKVVQRVPIKISLDIPDDIVLSPGMSVEVRIKRDE